MKVRVRVIGAPYRGKPVGTEFTTSRGDARVLTATNRVEALDAAQLGKAPKAPKAAAKKAPSKRATKSTAKTATKSVRGTRNASMAGKTETK